jgi:hypothetical protein
LTGKLQPTRPTAARARTKRRLRARPRAYSSTPTSVRISIARPIPFLSERACANRNHIATENNCPNAYAYAFDEGSGTALWTCNSTLGSDYRLTFCPCVCRLSSLPYHLRLMRDAPHRPPYGGQAAQPISAVPGSLIPSATSTSSSTTAAGASARLSLFSSLSRSTGWRRRGDYQ